MSATRTAVVISSFFFSSRRRHTRCYRDWSSDVCSSDLRGIAAGLEQSNVRYAAVRIDSEHHHCVGPARRPHGGINGALIPGLANPATHTVYIPRIAASKISPTLTLDGHPRRGTRNLRKTSGKIRITALAVRNRIVRRGRLILEGSGRARRGKGFLFFKFGDLCGVGLRLGGLRRFFFIKTLGWIAGVALCHDRFFGDGNP